MIFAPRSCPSRPGFATTTRILRSVAADGTTQASDADDDRVALRAARTDRGTPDTATAPTQLVHEGGEDARAGGADRMTQRNGATVDVDAILVDRQHAHRRNHD